jgi:hydrogenase-4 component B
MTTAALILAAFCLLGGAALLDVVVPAGRAGWRPWPYLLIAAGSVLLAVAGFRADLGHGGTLDLGTVFGFGHSALRADPLAGLFLALTGVVATPIALAFTGWVRHLDAAPYRGLAAAVALTVAAITVVVLADNAFVFLFGWEGLSVAFFLLTGYQREDEGQAGASVLTFGFSKASGSLLLIAFLLLYGATGSFQLADWHVATGAAHDAAFALALAGFAAKVGVVPLQVWMPTGYGAAPGPSRALMSAVAANAGFYGMWRTLALLGRPPEWLAVVLVLVAAFTALLGIAHAAVQRDLQRVIAYSSVENGGLITAGYAIALAGAAANQPPLMALGLLTSSLQMVAHAFAKSSLFLASAVIEQRAGTRDLDELRGVGAESPLAGAAFCIGAFTLAGLPLTLGFVSEWYLLESVMQLFRLDSLTLQLSLAVAGALIALAIGFAGFTFVRLVGLTILGRRRAAGARSAGGRLGAGTGLGLLIPAVACVAVTAVTPWEIRFLAHGLSVLAPVDQTTGSLQSPWVLGPVYRDFSVLSPSWLAVEMPVLAVLTVIMVAVTSRGGFLRVRRVPAWRSATGGVAGDGRYTPFAFANPTRHVLGNLLLTRSGLAALERETRAEEDAASAFTGPDMPPGEQDRAGRTAALEGAHHHHATYSTDVVEVIETMVYRPLLAPLQRIVAVAKRLQSGRLDAYITYMLIVVIALIAVVVGLS